MGPLSGRSAAGRCRQLHRRPVRTATTHVGGNPTRVDCVDEDAVAAQFGGEHPGERIERHLRDAVRGSAAAHVSQRPGSAGHIHNPPVSTPAQQPQKSEREPPRTKQIRFERIADDAEVSWLARCQVSYKIAALLISMSSRR